MFNLMSRTNETCYVSCMAIRPKLCGNYAFPQNFHTTKSGEITIFFQVHAMLVNTWIMWIVNTEKGWLISFEECNEGIDGNETIFNANLYDYGKASRSCTRYVILLIVVFVLIIISISGAWFCFYRHRKRNYVDALSY